MINDLNEIYLNHSPLTAHYMPRPRLDRIFDHAARCKLVSVIAGAGYGKTQAVHNYIERRPDAVVRWMQLTENDNIGTRYWENLTHIISRDNPDLAARLRELGFPVTLACFKQFAEIVKSMEHRSRKTFLVLDDFHLIHSKQALIFAERCAYLQIPGACVIIISRSEPGINVIPLFSKGHASVITEDELRFTEDEIATFLKYRDIPFSAKDLSRFASVTKGWALAVKLLSLVLKRIPNNLDLALGTMKQNIFKLLEIEAWGDFPERLQRALAGLSLVSGLPFAPLREIFDEAGILYDTPGLTSLIWFDSFIGDYRIHPLYLEFLRSKQPILSAGETQDAYRRAARWCSENGFYMDAINYYARSHQYERILQTFLSYPFKLPRDACAYLLDILEALDPDNTERSDQNVLLLKNLFIPLLLVGTGRYDEARERSLAVISEWERADTPFSLNLLYTAYSNLAYIDTYTCVVTHRYDFSEHLKKSVEYYKRSTIPPLAVDGPFAVAHIRSYACLVGEGADMQEFDRFLKAAHETALYVAETSHNMYYGYDDLSACELAFFKNQLDLARNFAHHAILKAREKKQHSIEAMAEQYLLRIAAQEGDYPLIREILKNLRAHLDNPNFWNRQILYDLITGSFYAQIGLPGMAPTWFNADEKEAASEVRIHTRELIVSARYYIASKKYNRALAVLCKAYPREPHERFHFGELMLSLLLAVARIKTGDTEGATADFEKAYRMSFGGAFEMFFIELGRNLRPLIDAEAARADCAIPDEWLKTIGRKASVYAKKIDVIRNAVKKEKNIKDTVQLSDREGEVLSDLYHGLNREEIAVNRHLSVNTVKKILQSIYIKLDANNNVDAIRIAIEKKLIE